jgi:hypothetical protein
MDAHIIVNWSSPAALWMPVMLPKSAYVFLINEKNYWNPTHLPNLSLRNVDRTGEAVDHSTDKNHKGAHIVAPQAVKL